MPSVKTIAVAVVLLGAGGAYWYLARDGSTSDAVGYQTEAITVGRIESLVNTAGTISPVVTVDVGSEVSGLVSELYADFNSEVESGQVIARIDDRTIRARLRQSEADVLSAKANIEQQQANITRAEADLQLAEREVVRQRELIERQLSSQAEVDRAEATLKVTGAQLEVARSQLSAARASLQQREAQLEQAQLDLDRTYIRSPVAGTVIDRQVDVGQTVAASLQAPLLFQIAQDLTQMQIEADVDEADIGQVTEGLTARFTVDAFPNRTFTGTVTQVRKAATVTNNVVTYKVIVGAQNPRQQLLPGMTANVNIVLGEKDGVLRVNNSALRFNPPGVEAAAAGSFGGGEPGGGMAGRIEELAEELNLTSEQRKAVENAFDSMRESLAELRNNNARGGFGFPGGFGNGREQMQRARQSMTNELASVLTPEQQQRFEQSLGGGFGGGARGGFAGGEGGPFAARMTPGQLWVLDGGEPRSVRVMTGLSDSQYTEFVSQEIGEGDEVIVRLAR